MFTEKQIAEIKERFNSLNGAKFVGVNVHRNEKTNEIANFVVNTNIKVNNAKEKDFNKLKSLTDKDLQIISERKNLPLDMLSIRFDKMIERQQRNLNPDLNKRTKQSQGQTNAYVEIAKGIVMHKVSGDVYISGFKVSKKVLVKGEYKKVNHGTEWYCGHAIEEYCEFRMRNFLRIKLGNVYQLKVAGDTINCQG